MTNKLLNLRLIFNTLAFLKRDAGILRYDLR